MHFQGQGLASGIQAGCCRAQLLGFSHQAAALMFGECVDEARLQRSPMHAGALLWEELHVGCT